MRIFRVAYVAIFLGIISVSLDMLYYLIGLDLVVSDGSINYLFYYIIFFARYLPEIVLGLILFVKKSNIVEQKMRLFGMVMILRGVSAVLQVIAQNRNRAPVSSSSFFILFGVMIFLLFTIAFRLPHFNPVLSRHRKYVLLYPVSYVVGFVIQIFFLYSLVNSSFERDMSQSIAFMNFFSQLYHSFFLFLLAWSSQKISEWWGYDQDPSLYPDGEQ